MPDPLTRDQIVSKINDQEENSKEAIVNDAQEELSCFEKLLRSVQNDEKCLKEVILGKRIGLYRFRGGLGQGNFSQVKLAMHELTRERVAIKIIDKNTLDDKTRNMLGKEIATLQCLQHPNIIRSYEVIDTYIRTYLITEYASGGELHCRLMHIGPLTEEQAKIVFAQLVSAVIYMHECNCIHRDLKAENVIFTGNGLHVKIVDMGFSTKVTSANDRLSTFCGSPPYAAPELFRDEWYTGELVDIWALGVLLYFMVSSTMPFKGNTLMILKKNILSGEFSDPEVPVSKDCISTIRKLLKQTPRERMPLKELFAERQWLANKTIIKDKIENLQEIEIETKVQLMKLGVSEMRLNEVKERGVGSPVSGAYRILAHRIEKEMNHTSENYAKIFKEPSIDNSPKKKKAYYKKPRDRASITCQIL